MSLETREQLAVMGNSQNRYEIDEKNAIIALQAILTARGVVTEEKYQRFGYYLNRLPPYRAILVYGQVMNAIANKMDEDSPYRDAVKKLGQTITTNISPDFPKQVEQSPEFFEAECKSLADNLNKISTLIHHVRENAAA
jgi:hypothetical protein